MAKKVTKKVVKKKKGVKKAGFVYVGDPYATQDDIQSVEVICRGYTFKLNGNPVAMDDRVDERYFENHPHFKKV